MNEQRMHPLFCAALSFVLLSGCEQRAVHHPAEFRAERLRFAPPPVERVMLDCGAPCYLLPDRRLPLVDFFCIAPAGSAYDPGLKEGLAALTATVMRTGGTAELPADALDRELELRAAEVSAGTDQDAGTVALSCLSSVMDSALPYTLDIILHPAFAPEKLELRKAQMRELIRRWNDEPREIAEREFQRLVYGNHPYAHPVIGEPGSMDRISRDDLVAYHREHFRPSLMIFGVAGDFDRAAVIGLLNRRFGSARAPAPPPIPPVPTPAALAVDYLWKATEQAHLLIGNTGMRRDDPDYLVMTLMNDILGGSAFSSRMLERVRAEKGLAYHAGTNVSACLQAGLVYAVCQTKERSATTVLRIIIGEMERIREESVTPGELERAMDAAVNRFVFRFTRPSQVVTEMAWIEFYGLPRDYLATYVSRVMKITGNDILRVARAYLHPDRATILVVGERDQFEEPLDTFGPVRTIPLPRTE
ncbi:MAG: pitrilysin family protein [Candidatus Aureabacteria bacterium]|nr:pitrilysin family protein [Candidatus Auribacterota bacterium]